MNMNVKVIVDLLNVRRKPSKQSKILRTISKGDICEISETERGFGKLVNEDGWIMLKFTEEV